MKIIETKKAIIELIKLYMDKTLSEGCLILWFLCDNEWKPIDDNEIEYKTFLKETTKWYCKTVDWEYEVYRVFWHYDITAVLKFIEKKNKLDDMISFDTDGEYFYINTTGKVILNKPLHLYTEEEDKQLLEILTEIEWNH